MKALEARILPIIPLQSKAVLLPGAALRIPITNRPDIFALLAQIFSPTATPRPDVNSVSIGCLPLRSPHLSSDGHPLHSDGNSSEGLGQGRPLVESERAQREDLLDIGTVAKIIGVRGRGSGEPALILEGINRFTLKAVTRKEPYIEAEVICHHDEGSSSDAILQDNFAHLKQLSRELLSVLRLSSLLPRGSPTALSPLVIRRLDIFVARKDVQHAGILADFMTNLIDTSYEEKLQILAAVRIKDRLERVIDLLSKQVSGLTEMKLTPITSSYPVGIDFAHLNQKQREAFARKALGSTGSGQMGSAFLSGRNEDGDDDGNELDDLMRKLEEANLTPEAQKVAQRELKRLRKMSPAQAEYQVCRNYLENISEIPWSRITEDDLGVATLPRARKQLDDDHYGLDKVKKRLLEYLAVLKLKQSVNSELEAKIQEMSTTGAKAQDQSAPSPDRQALLPDHNQPDVDNLEVRLLKSKRMVDKSPILLLVGPPGTGKTSLAKSVATALGRKFHRISLGGVRDEAEIRGHRRTYVAAMPGLIVNGLKKVGVANPVFLLDEIDKVGTSNFHGDPSAAMLEVLDPEQNHTFTDHYVNIPIDLSRVLFIATANSLETIPPPLLDRMETISLPGYTTIEKRHIANDHLIPKQITTNGLGDGQVLFDDSVIDKIITAYTRESGVRNLEREIGAVCRYKAVEYADAKDESRMDSYAPRVNVDDLEEILGVERFDEEIAERSSRPGIVTGLVAYSSGGQGSILFIEVADMPGTGRVQLTGKLGDILKESVEVALSWVKAHSYELGLIGDPSEDIMKNRSIHVHCPSGAVPKDGPSAGLAHTIAMISLFSGKPVPPSLAMTGEISLRGRVMPVGGIKEKLIGALRAGVKTVLLPVLNRKDVKDLPQEVKDGLNIIHVR
ncbi:MAG: hypothetical protein M1836_006161 [Candelina mexicana]|nr:MAG: hypothetical protein M1836_006161 [Candelina mexicana]